MLYSSKKEVKASWLSFEEETKLGYEIEKRWNGFTALKKGIKNVLDQQNKNDSKWVMGYLNQLLKEGLE